MACGATDRFPDEACFSGTRPRDRIGSRGWPTHPVLVAEVDGESKLERFVADTLEESLSRANAYAQALPGSASAYVIAHDGFVTIEGKRSDAILVEAAERTSAQAACLRSTLPAEEASPEADHNR